MNFKLKREKLVLACESIGINEKDIYFDKDIVPRRFPASIITLGEAEGNLKTASRYADYESLIDVYLIVDINDAIDPDLEIHDFSMKFREKCIAYVQKDIDKIKYYPAKADSGRKVKIAKVRI